MQITLREEKVIQETIVYHVNEADVDEKELEQVANIVAGEVVDESALIALGNFVSKYGTVISSSETDCDTYILSYEDVEFEDDKWIDYMKSQIEASETSEE